MTIPKEYQNAIISLWEEKAYLERRNAEVQSSINSLLMKLGVSGVEMTVTPKPNPTDPMPRGQEQGANG